MKGFTRISKLVIVIAAALTLPAQASSSGWAVDSTATRRLDSLDREFCKLQSQLKALEPTPSPVTFGMTMFGYFVYSRDGINGKDYNKFDMERTYLTAKGQLADQWRMQVTSDMYRGNDTNTFYKGISVRIKFAFVEYTPGSFSFKFGLIPGQFNSVEEGSWKYRGISTVASDRYSYLPTADVGISAVYLLPEKYGDVALFLTNGGGYSAPETDKFKDVTVRGVFNPFPAEPVLGGIKLAGFYTSGYDNSKKYGGLPKNRGGAFVSLKYDVVSAGVTYLVRRDSPVLPDSNVAGRTVSVFGEVRMPWEELKSFSLIGRLDSVEPSDKKTGDKFSYLIAGLVYKANDKLTFSLDYQSTTGEGVGTLAKSGGGTAHYDGRAYLHMIVIL